MKLALLAFGIAATFGAIAAPRPIVSLTDPIGDDYGGGNLVYPQRNDYQAGDLDLVSLQISRDEKGFWFEVSFKNPIKGPMSTATTPGQESWNDFVRQGFYQFNLDIYVDTDRVLGAGNTFTLPGRHARIDPGYAWERVVVVTPRPEAARAQLLQVLTKQFPNRPRGEAEATIDQTMFFPTDIRIQGKTARFFVPGGYFAGSDGSDWAVTALVTAARRPRNINPGAFPGGKVPLDDVDLGVMQAQQGRSPDYLGYGSGAKLSPIVDILSPTVEQQIVQLGSDTPLTGMSWGAHAANDVLVKALERPSLPAKEVPGRGTGSGTAPATFTTLQALFDSPKTAPVATPVVAKPPSVPERLKVLQQLFDQKLIDGADYQQQRQRILNGV